MAARILVIEDNPDNMELMTYLLQAFGHTPLKAEDGEEGMKIARREALDLIICDIHLPKMDGYEIVRLLKADTVLQRIPIIAVTALAMVGDREKMIAAGFDDYIAKPIVPETFITQVEAFLPTEQRSTAIAAMMDSTVERRIDKVEADLAETGSTHQSPSCRLPRHAVLIVDDSAVNRELLKATLEPFGYMVTPATSVREAMTLARQVHFDLFLCDMQMPDEDGWAFLHAVKSDPKLSTIPLIILSSSVLDDADKARAYALGAARFLLRPIETEKLLKEIASCLVET